MAEKELRQYLKSLAPEDAKVYMANYRAFRPGISPEESTHVYDQWATYEQDLNHERYKGPVIAAEAVAEFFTTDREKVLIIDIACGTGFVGQELKKLGFNRIHGLDPSLSSLEKARQKNAYEQVFQGYVDEKPLPLVDDLYDCAVISGGMGEGHIPTTGLYQLARIVKPGGLVCIVTREEYMEKVAEYRGQLMDTIKKMESEGLWKLTARVVVPRYFLDKNGIVLKFVVC